MKNKKKKQQEIESFRETMENLPKKNSYIDRKNLGITMTQNKPYESVMKNLAEKIRG